MDANLVSDPFLKRVLREKEVDISRLLEKWALNEPEFEATLDRWFDNFSSAEKQLALKVLLNLDYYSVSRFQNVVGQRGQRISQMLHTQGTHELSDAFILLPEKRGDSSDAHAYALTKEWGVRRERIVTASTIETDDLGTFPIILFNDTHGSGHQFMEDWLPRLKPLIGRHPIFLVAIVIAPAAMKRFQDELVGITVLPDEPAINARNSPFTADDLDLLRTIGTRVCPKHPLGYGETALLTAYSFQCPNNSLPIIWANGRNSGGCPWSPLFVYKPKTSRKPKVEIGDTKAPPPSLPAHEPIGPVTPPVTPDSPSGSGDSAPSMLPRISLDIDLPDIFTPGIDAASLRAALGPIIGEARTEQVIAISEAAIGATADSDFAQQASLGKELIKVAGEVPEFHASGLYFAAEGYRLLADIASNDVEKRRYQHLAEEHYQDALRIAPDAPSPLRGLGRLRELEGDYDQAMRLFEAAHGFAVAGFAAGRTLEKAPALAHEILRTSRHHIHCILGIAAADTQSKWRREINRTELAGEIAKSDRYHKDLMKHFRSSPRWLYIECFMAMVFLARAWGAIGNTQKAEYYYLEALYARRKLLGPSPQFSRVERANLKWWLQNTRATSGLSTHFINKSVMLESMLDAESHAHTVLQLIDDLIEPVSAVRSILPE